MLEKMIKLFADSYEGEEDIAFSADTEIMDDLEFSSLEFFSIISSIEEEFDVKISERELQTIVTIGDVAKILEAKQS